MACWKYLGGAPSPGHVFMVFTKYFCSIFGFKDSIRFLSRISSWKINARDLDKDCDTIVKETVDLWQNVFKPQWYLVGIVLSNYHCVVWDNSWNPCISCILFVEYGDLISSLKSFLAKRGEVFVYFVSSDRAMPCLEPIDIVEKVATMVESFNLIRLKSTSWTRPVRPSML